MSTLMPSWAQRYLERLKLSVKPPSFAYLSEICRAHLTTFAFENVSKLIYYRDQEQNGFLIPPHDVYVENAFRYDFGGTCYTNNSRLKLLLDALGFVSYHVRLGRNHLAILVELPDLPGERVYVDTGAASPFFRPVRFESDPHNSSVYGVDEIQLKPIEEQPGHYQFTRYRRGELVPSDWVFNPNVSVEFSDLAEVIEASNQPGAFFMKQLRIQLWQLDRERNVSLVDNIFTIRGADMSQEQHELSSIEEIERVVRDEFRLPKLPVREAIEVLQTLGVDVFSPKDDLSS